MTLSEAIRAGSKYHPIGQKHFFYLGKTCPLAAAMYVKSVPWEEMCIETARRLFPILTTSAFNPVWKSQTTLETCILDVTDAGWTYEQVIELVKDHERECGGIQMCPPSKEEDEVFA